MKARTIALLVVVLLALGAAGWAGLRITSRRARPTLKGDELVMTTAAKRQDLLIAVTQTGVVVSKSSDPVIPEISGRIQWICENGIVVPAGETVLRLDPTNLEKQLVDLTVRYEEAVRKQEQAEVVGAARMKEVRLRLKRQQDDVAAFERQQKTDLQKASDSIDFHAAELETRREDLEVKRRLAKQGLVPGTDVEREEAGLKASEFALRRERNDFELATSKASAEAIDRHRGVDYTSRDMSRTSSRSEREVRMSGNEIDNLTLQLERAREDLARSVLKAPVGGLVVISAQGGWRGDSGLPRTGDLVSQGREVAEIVSLDRMQVKLELDQTQITGVKMGQAAEVTIEALPGKVLKGKVTAIGQTARRPPVQGWMGMSATATFPVAVDLPPTGKALIRPGMRASIRLVSRRIDDVVTVPSSCIFRHNGQSVVFVERDGEFRRVGVTAGESNDDYTAILKGLEEGDRIALNDLGASPSTSERPKGTQR